MDGVIIHFFDLNRAPQGTNVWRPWVIGVLQQFDGKDDVVGGKGGTVVPAHVLAEVKYIEEAVHRDLPLLGQVRHGLSLAVEIGQSIKDQGTYVLVCLVISSEEGVDGAGGSGDPFHIGSPDGGNGNRPIVEGQIGEEGGHQDQARGYEGHLPANCA